jgi:mono/diheme cytochrome c family protein
MHRIGTYLIALPAVFLLLAAIRTSSASGSFGQSPSSPEFYTAQVSPILQTNCARCHSGLNHRGGFSIETKESLLKGGRSGPAIVAGHPEQSLLITLVHPLEANGADDRHMPPKGQLTNAEIVILGQWIKAGAIVPDQR